MGLLCILLDEHHARRPTYYSIDKAWVCHEWLLNDTFNPLAWMPVEMAERAGASTVANSNTTKGVSTEPTVCLNAIRPCTNDDQILPTALEQNAGHTKDVACHFPKPIIVSVISMDNP